MDDITQANEKGSATAKIGRKTWITATVILVIAVVVAYFYLTSSKSSGTPGLANINQPLNNSELSIINNEPLNYYELAGEKLLNGDLQNQIGVQNPKQFKPFIVNGKPSVIYIGAISCVMCGQNRWAMALALATFGNFTSLYKGYSSLHDGDVPTLYWSQYNYTTNSGVGFGNFYKSNVINFYSADYESPITGGFQVQPISYFEQQANNQTYLATLKFMNSTDGFTGTPFTFWGTYLWDGADGVVFGNFSVESISGTPLSAMNHTRILYQIKNFNDQFAWSEYAAADVYIAMLCPSLNNTVKVCSLPAIKGIERQL